MSASSQPAEGTIVDSFSHFAGMALEMAGVAIIVVGAVLATLAYLISLKEKAHATALSDFRANLGRGILLGLEFLVAGDIIGTVAAGPTWESVGILTVIVLIRTFLSFTLEAEINGRFPWQASSKGGGRGRDH